LAPLIAKEGLVGHRWTMDEILCPLFPKVYLSTLSKRNEESRLRTIEHLKSTEAARVNLRNSIYDDWLSGFDIDIEV